jgi:hypothetical protein
MCCASSLPVCQQPKKVSNKAADLNRVIPKHELEWTLVAVDICCSSKTADQRHFITASTYHTTASQQHPSWMERSV